MTAILAAWQSQQLLKIKIPAVVLGQIDGVGAEIVLGLPEFQIAFFTMP
jgi:hypothetical protein